MPNIPNIITIAEATEDFPRHSEPSLIELRDGTLLIAWQEFIKSAKGGDDDAPNRISCAISHDSGCTWHHRRSLIETPQDDVNVYSPSFIRHRDGSILLAHFNNHISGANLKPQTTCFIDRTTDDGKCFEEYSTAWVRQPYSCASHVLKRLSSGRILLPICRQMGEDRCPTDQYQGGCLYSDDEGRTWIESSSWLALPMRGVMETHVEEMANGSVLMLMRTQLGAIFSSESHNEGNTWSKPQTTSLGSPESCPEITRVPSTGDAIAIWNNANYDPSIGHFGRRSPLSVALSKDSGRSWQGIREIVSSDFNGYSNPVCYLLRSGKVLVAYFEVGYTEDNHMICDRIHLRAALFNLDWLYGA